MQNSINLSIPKPCSEKWENFTPASTGGFCHSCSKIVVDFTKMSDDEIIHYFKDSPAHACGRFRRDQLKSYTQRTPVKRNPGLTLFKTSILSLLFLLTNKHGFAQSKTEKSATETIDQTRQPVSFPQVTSEGRFLKGVVVSAEDGSALPAVNVILKGTVFGISTDADGTFEFPHELKEGDVLVFSFIGLQTVEYTIRKEDKDTLKIKMVMMYFDMMGELTVDTLYTPKESGLRKVWNKLTGLL